VHEATKKGLWQELRTINGVAVNRASNAVKAVVGKDGVSVLTEPVEVLDRLKGHYADLAAEEHQDAHRSSVNIAERVKEIRKGLEWWAEISARSGASTLVGASRLNADVRADDVRKLFRSLNWWKSIGDDNVRSMVLLAMSESHEFIHRTPELFTAILRSRDIPGMWRTIVLSVLYKGKGSKGRTLRTAGA
jgi:hypothetical protein